MGGRDAPKPGGGGVLVGTSGWQYRDWRGDFYPARLPTAKWLEAYAASFCTVEVNGTFYRLPERSVVEAWRSRTPATFEFSLKASRFLTHVRRLEDPGPAVERLFERIGVLGDRLGPVLVQLPPTMRRDVPRLEAALAAFPRGVRVAVEPRHESWFTDEVAALLQRHDAAACLADRRGPIEPRWRTATWGYVRFHEGRASPAPSYGDAALRSWATWLAANYAPEERIYAYFNNDQHARAPRDAVRFARACRSVGLIAPLPVPSGEDDASRVHELAAGDR